LSSAIWCSVSPRFTVYVAAGGGSGVAIGGCADGAATGAPRPSVRSSTGAGRCVAQPVTTNAATASIVIARKRERD